MAFPSLARFGSRRSSPFGGARVKLVAMDGALATWVDDMQAALRGERSSDVDCGTCSACCTASQFVHVGPDEHDALAHIPAALLFPAPRLPEGHLLLGYDARGHCPLLVRGRCSVYEHRPRACRTYDCRIFTATGVDVARDDPRKREIAARAASWTLTVSTTRDVEVRSRLRAAVVELDDGSASPTEVAVRAVERVRADGAEASAPVPSAAPRPSGRSARPEARSRGRRR